MLFGWRWALLTLALRVAVRTIRGLTLGSLPVFVYDLGLVEPALRYERLKLSLNFRVDNIAYLHRLSLRS
jgi:hypothetical protein